MAAIFRIKWQKVVANWGLAIGGVAGESWLLASVGGCGCHWRCAAAQRNAFEYWMKHLNAFQAADRSNAITHTPWMPGCYCCTAAALRLLLVLQLLPPLLLPIDTLTHKSTLLFIDFYVCSDETFLCVFHFIKSFSCRRRSFNQSGLPTVPHSPLLFIWIYAILMKLVHCLQLYTSIAASSLFSSLSRSASRHLTRYVRHIWICWTIHKSIKDVSEFTFIIIIYIFLLSSAVICMYIHVYVVVAGNRNVRP